LIFAADPRYALCTTGQGKKFRGHRRGGKRALRGGRAMVGRGPALGCGLGELRLGAIRSGPVAGSTPASAQPKSAAALKESPRFFLGILAPVLADPTPSLPLYSKVQTRLSHFVTRETHLRNGHGKRTTGNRKPLRVWFKSRRRRLSTCRYAVAMSRSHFQDGPGCRC